VVAVAARDSARARDFATKHSIPRVVDSYEQLVTDPDIDAIYNPLPNGPPRPVDDGGHGRRQARLV